MKRIFLIVLDSVGIGSAPDADSFGDKGADTFFSCGKTGLLDIPNMQKIGIYNIDGLNFGEPTMNPSGIYGKLTEASMGKDTTIGHWEISGVISSEPLPTYPNGFPAEVLDEFSRLTGRNILCNKTYSGTQVINDYGQEHIKTGALIVYTSADSVFQIAAHEDIVPVEKLYEYCEIARKILVGKHGVGRVIARPFIGEYPDFKRTSNRHDFSLKPPAITMLDKIKAENLDVIGIGKIYDIFAGQGITEFVRTKNNEDGMDKTIEYADKDFNGLCFVNLVDFDMLYGHRRDSIGYAKALNAFDKRLGELLSKLKNDDTLIITADHGCDPDFKGTDHTREYVPYLMYGANIKAKNIGTKDTFAFISEQVCEILDIS